MYSTLNALMTRSLPFLVAKCCLLFFPEVSALMSNSSGKTFLCRVVLPPLQQGRSGSGSKTWPWEEVQGAARSTQGWRAKDTLYATASARCTTWVRFRGLVS